MKDKNLLQRVNAQNLLVKDNEEECHVWNTSTSS